VVATGVVAEPVDAVARTTPAAPPLVLDPAQSGADNGAEAWRALGQDFSDTRPLGSEADFDAPAAAHWVDDLLLSRARFDASIFWREPSRFPSGESGFVTIQWSDMDAICGPVGDHALYIATGRVAFHDFALPWRGWSENSEIWRLAVPRERIADAELLRLRASLVSVPVGSPSGLVLTAALRTAWETVQRVPGSGGELASALVGLVNGVLATTGRRLNDDVRLAAMKSYLRHRLADPALAGADLQRHFHYSRATVYRLFGPDGGVANFIRNERLRRCHDELAHPDQGGRTTVACVAARWGYADPAQFGRAFRSRYGRPPRDVLREARAAQPPQMSSTKRSSARSCASQT
jgi:AraC-like DNA-binding protein